MHIYAQTCCEVTHLINCNCGVFSSGCFALQKLKKEAAEEGAYLICWSAVNYENLVLIVHNKNKVILKKSCRAGTIKGKKKKRADFLFKCHCFLQTGSAQNHKQFQIKLKGSKFCLDGWDLQYSSVRELMDSLKNFVLVSGSESFTLKKCCLPRHGGLELVDLQIIHGIFCIPVIIYFL